MDNREEKNETGDLYGRHFLKDLICHSNEL